MSHTVSNQHRRIIYSRRKYMYMGPAATVLQTVLKFAKPQFMAFPKHRYGYQVTVLLAQPQCYPCTSSFGRGRRRLPEPTAICSAYLVLIVMGGWTAPLEHDCGVA